MVPARKLMGEIIEKLPDSAGKKESNETTFLAGRHFIHCSHKSFDSAVLPPV
jgi:hypothetical protein